jgi:myo-inositol 2-dehydrogenase/D-chiro-inositol 1-dehydrogenase
MDNTSILMKFKNGVMVILTASRNSTYGYHAPMEIFGTKGAIRIGDDSFNTRNVYADEAGVTRHCSTWFYEYWKDTYRAEMAGFVECLREGTAPRVTFEDGYKAVEWAIRADQAVKEGKAIHL